MRQCCAEPSILKYSQGRMQVPHRPQIYSKIQKKKENSKINQNDHSAVYKWVKTDEFLRGYPLSPQISMKNIIISEYAPVYSHNNILVVRVLTKITVLPTQLIIFPVFWAEKN